MDSLSPASGLSCVNKDDERHILGHIISLGVFIYMTNIYLLVVLVDSKEDKLVNFLKEFIF